MDDSRNDEIAQLRAALEPFAWIGSWLFARPEISDDEPLASFSTLNSAKPVNLTRGHFKAAHTAFAGTRP